MILSKLPEGATPIDPDETEEFIASYVTTREQLNELEEANIIEAENWSFSYKRSEILTIDFCKLLHKKMFYKVWKWAGKFRISNKNIGCSKEQISQELKKLLEDVQYQLDHKVYSIDEIALRFHHRLVQIHPFPNGNGRHGRLMTDILLKQQNVKPFTWGNRNLITNNKTRKAYITALKEADRGNYEKLRIFVRD